ncbi:effector-associated constant component EACC1 [Pseudomonas sp. IzPS59]|uniref:effector-associated constant component EACC1 n=1 Tax=Pseudomonas sp. IzPS59 TaxID=2774459 RepID=UPI001787955F|nr:hypothetical protein [Pseudomonas sp. IzPS59]
MNTNQYLLTIEAENDRDSDSQARALADKVRELKGVESSDRKKSNENTMDLGAIISVIATSGASLALAQGLADWLRMRRTTNLTIERNLSTNSIKVIVERIDPETAKQIVELVRSA